MTKQKDPLFLNIVSEAGRQQTHHFITLEVKIAIGKLKRGKSARTNGILSVGNNWGVASECTQSIYFTSYCISAFQAHTKDLKLITKLSSLSITPKEDAVSYS